MINNYRFTLQDFLAIISKCGSTKLYNMSKVPELTDELKIADALNKISRELNSVSPECLYSRLRDIKKEADSTRLKPFLPLWEFRILSRLGDKTNDLELKNRILQDLTALDEEAKNHPTSDRAKSVIIAKYEVHHGSGIGDGYISVKLSPEKCKFKLSQQISIPDCCDNTKELYYNDGYLLDDSSSNSERGPMVPICIKEQNYHVKVEHKGQEAMFLVNVELY